jgi:hypothetical protein
MTWRARALFSSHYAQRGVRLGGCDFGHPMRALVGLGQHEAVEE